MILGRNYEAFAVLYTFGNLIAVSSSLFLKGPRSQCKSMGKSHRIGCVAVYFGAMILTLIVAFESGEPGLCILCIFIQWCAAMWYFLSYIPGGRAAVKSCAKSALGV